jgi:stage V sporulation protein SpoVS
MRSSQGGLLHWLSGTAPRNFALVSISVAEIECGRHPVSQLAELTVGGSSEPKVVAGAIAARVREEKNVTLTAIGVDAVANAIRSICHARLYLEVGAARIPPTAPEAPRVHAWQDLRLVHCCVLATALGAGAEAPASFGCKCLAPPPPLPFPTQCPWLAWLVCWAKVVVSGFTLDCNILIWVLWLMQEDRVDIKALPQFEHVTKGGQQLSAVRFNIVVEET